ncbi:hypothetical protein HDU91_003509 [Kappamyces sp. JEL0680]|nr:hypothetical protein HDU91_003509 [Kappamyces sp. JEL0680]
MSAVTLSIPDDAASPRQSVTSRSCLKAAALSHDSEVAASEARQDRDQTRPQVQFSTLFWEDEHRSQLATIHRLQDQVAVLQQENARLELDSIVTFTAMSQCPTLFSPDEPDGLLKPTARKPHVPMPGLPGLAGAGDAHSETALLMLENQELRDKLQKLEYVSRLWAKYMHNLTLMQKKIKDLQQELQDGRQATKDQRTAIEPSTVR